MDNDDLDELYRDELREQLREADFQRQVDEVVEGVFQASEADDWLRRMYGPEWRTVVPTGFGTLRDLAGVQPEGGDHE